MIPEAVWEYTGACRVTPRKQLWETPLGRFSYRQVKFFLGFERQILHGQPTLIATPEKALLDHWYWSEGEWARERHGEMRYQNLELIKTDQLEALSLKFRSPRMTRTLETFLQILTESHSEPHTIAS
jgi:hypothetical protein